MSESSHRIQLVADLRLEVGDRQGATTAHLHGAQDGLVLDVGDPATLLRSVPGRGLSRDLPIQIPHELLADTPVQLRSQGKDLGRIRLTPKGKLRFRPTGAGLVVAGRAAASYRSHLAGWVIVAVVAAGLAGRRLRR